MSMTRTPSSWLGRAATQHGPLSNRARPACPPCFTPGALSRTVAPYASAPPKPGRAAVGAGSPLDDLRRRVHVTAEVLADTTIGPHIAGLVGDTQSDPLLARELHQRLVAPARAQHRELICAAQSQGELRADVDPDLVADTLFAPLWFRLLVTRAELSPRFADDITDTVMTAWTQSQANGQHR